MKPNILIFQTDQHQAATIEPGHPCLAPNIRGFYEKGMRFTRAYTPCPLCSPARASMMTSLYPHAHGMLNNPHVAQAIRTGLKGKFPMFSDRLREAGYRLHWCGKWHVSNEEFPRDHGWDEPDEKTTKALWSHWPLRDFNPKGYSVEREGYRPYLLWGKPGAGVEAFSEYHWTNYAIGQVEKFGRGGKPWCLYLGLHGPHDPFVAPDEFMDKYDPSRVPRPASWDDPLTDKPAVYRRHRDELWVKMEWKDYSCAIAAYWAYVSFIDDLFGRVLAALEKTGQAENTLVIFTSDHGEMAGSHGLFFKGVLAFEECWRIPLAIRWPAGIKPGQVCEEFVNLLDLGPTMLELGLARAMPGIHGRSFAPLLRGDVPADWPQEHFGQYFGSELLYTQKVLVTKRHKYVFNGFDFDELYDLVSDPAEMHNLYFSASHRPVLKEMAALMWNRARAVGDEITCRDYPTTDLVPFGPGPEV